MINYTTVYVWVSIRRTKLTRDGHPIMVIIHYKIPTPSMTEDEILKEARRIKNEKARRRCEETKSQKEIAKQQRREEETS